MTESIVSLPELKNRRFVFRDRDHAGNVLGDMIRADSLENAILLAIPAGGVPVAVAAAGQTGFPTDIATVSKITLPWNTEAGYGAIAFDGTMRLNEEMLPHLNLTKRQMDEGIEATREKVMRRERMLRGGEAFPSLSGKTAILVDDGLASGFTMFCAIDAVKHAGASRVVVAVPTAPLRTARAVEAQAHRVYCPNIREGASFAVADAYENWYDLTDQEIMEMMRRS